ncbi:MAG: hypothetical protein QOG91_127 [Candidatus Parcubacteria bacterium]|jgi:hypothetical protein|nr:hypothetical protein [Candidatus Parcubacteria bacterium]
MNKLINVPNARRIWSPHVYKFPDIPESSGIDFRDWSWYEMEELHSAVITICQNQGYKGHGNTANDQPFPAYRTFRPEYLLLGEDNPFVAVIYHQNKSRVQKDSLEVNYTPQLDQFDFFGEGMHVPSTWGDAVIILAKQGVIRIEHRENGRLFTTRWDNSEIDEGTSLHNLFRGL